MKERGRELKTTSNECIECVGNPLENDLPLCILLASPARKSNKIENIATSLFRQDGPYIGQLLEMNYFTNAARSRISDFLLMCPPSCTLKSTLWLKALVKCLTWPPFPFIFRGPPLDSHFFHVLHPTNPTKVPSLESPGVVAVVGRRINNRTPKTAGNKADTSHFNPNFHWDY